MDRDDADRWAVMDWNAPDRKKQKILKVQLGKLFRYMSRYKLRFVMVFIFAVDR